MRRRLAMLGALALLGVAAARPAGADEPVSAREPHLMSETSEITTVADAFDGDDPFDLNLVLGFNQSWKHAKIRRETSLAQNGLSTGGFVPATENIATYSSSMSTLLLGADVGLYHDLALILRLPLILGWSQDLSDLDGSSFVSNQLLSDSMGGVLFNVPSSSPTRSGVDYFSMGLDWAIMNQQRDPTSPTWVIGFETRIGIGTPLHACTANPPAGTPQCPDPSNPGVDRDPGISRGMDTFVLKSIWSRRFGYVEPYSGVWLQGEYPQDGSDFGRWNPTTNLERMPPVLGTFGLGMEVIPYERREEYQRLSADFRFKGTYHSPGRDYSELFDALGSSQAPALRTPAPSAYVGTAAGSVADPNAAKVYFAGITEAQAYGSFTVSAAGTWQAGEYVKFTLGTALTYAQSHLVTAADACNPNFSGDSSLAGPCKSQSGGPTLGIPNPDHREAIDMPGHRFSVDDTTIVDLWVMGVVMF
jgi:hypothetical protein